MVAFSLGDCRVSSQHRRVVRLVPGEQGMTWLPVAHNDLKLITQYSMTLNSLILPPPSSESCDYRRVPALGPIRTFYYLPLNPNDHRGLGFQVPMCKLQLLIGRARWKGHAERKTLTIQSASGTERLFRQGTMRDNLTYRSGGKTGNCKFGDPRNPTYSIEGTWTSSRAPA